MNEIEGIKSKIYEIRGKQVMLDSDLALLYGVETKRINETVQRNKEKFSNNIAFKVSINEINLRSQIATSSYNEYGGRRYNPYVFNNIKYLFLTKQPSFCIIGVDLSRMKFKKDNKNDSIKLSF
jgi:hypothetical protein